MTDIQIQNCGTITVVQPLTYVGQEWVDANMVTEPWQQIAGGVAIEPTYLEPILEAMADDGLEVQS